MRSSFLMILFLWIGPILHAQSEGGIEQYHYFGGNGANSIVPVIHLQSKRGWYGEARYNYDEINTFSLLGGKTFSGYNKLNWSITPLLGISFGEMNGYITGVNFSIEKNKYFFNTQSQYTIAATSNYTNYFFTWSEWGYQPLKWLYGGFTIQYTQVVNEAALVEPGLLLGITIHKLTFPMYIFNTLSNNRFLVLGVNWEWTR